MGSEVYGLPRLDMSSEAVVLYLVLTDALGMVGRVVEGICSETRRPVRVRRFESCTIRRWHRRT